MDKSKRSYVNAGCLAGVLLIVAVSSGRAAVSSPGARVYGGISVTNAQWSDGLGMNDLLSYDFDTELFTKLEGKLASRKTGLSMGVDIEFDSNDISKANRVLGYVGFRRLFLRAASSDMTGTVTWDNSKQLPGYKQQPKLAFDSTYKYVDLIYYMKWMPMFIGLGYTSYQLPTEVKAYSSPDGEKHYERVGAYDPDYEVALYNFVLGFDTFAESVFMGTEMGSKSKDGMGFFMAMEDRFGIGDSNISDATLQVLEDNNPGFRAKKETSRYWLIEMDANLGLRYTKTTQAGSAFSLGLGYEFAFIFGDAFSGVADTPTELELQPTHGLIRQGPMARFYFRW